MDDFWTIGNDTIEYIRPVQELPCICNAADSGAGLKVADSLLLVGAATTVLVNLTFILTVLYNRPLHTYTNKLLVSNAFVDLLVGCVVMPFHILKSIQDNCWQFGEIMCEIAQSIDVHLTTISIFHFTGVAAERYLRIVKTFWYERWIKRLIPFIIIFYILPTPSTFVGILTGWHQQGAFTRQVNWIHVSPVGNVSHVVSQMRNECGKPNPKERPCRCSFWASRAYTGGTTVFQFILPILIMIFFYTRIFMVAFAHAKKIEQMRMSVLSNSLSLNQMSVGESSTDGELNSPRPSGMSVQRRSSTRYSLLLSKDIRMVRLCALVFLVFLLSWSPYFIMAMLEAYCVGPNYLTDEAIFAPTEEHRTEAYNLWIGFFTTLWLGFFNSLMNPLIIFAMEKNYRHGFSLMVHRKLPYLAKLLHLSSPRKPPRAQARSASVDALDNSLLVSPGNGTTSRRGRFFDHKDSELEIQSGTRRSTLH